MVYNLMLFFKTTFAWWSFPSRNTLGIHLINEVLVFVMKETNPAQPQEQSLIGGQWWVPGRQLRFVTIP